MGWVIFILVIALIAQSIRASNLKHDLWTETKVTEAKMQYIKTLEEENKDYRQWLFGQGLFGRKEKKSEFSKN